MGSLGFIKVKALPIKRGLEQGVVKNLDPFEFLIKSAQKRDLDRILQILNIDTDTLNKLQTAIDGGSIINGPLLSILKKMESSIENTNQILEAINTSSGNNTLVFFILFF